MWDWQLTPLEWLSTSCDLDLDLGSSHMAYCHASVIELYLHIKLHWNRKNVCVDGLSTGTAPSWRSCDTITRTNIKNPAWSNLDIVLYTMSQKKGATLTMHITLSILDRFAKFFHCCKQQISLKLGKLFFGWTYGHTDVRTDIRTYWWMDISPSNVIRSTRTRRSRPNKSISSQNCRVYVK